MNLFKPVVVNVGLPPSHEFLKCFSKFLKYRPKSQGDSCVWWKVGNTPENRKNLKVFCECTTALLSHIRLGETLAHNASQSLLELGLRYHTPSLSPYGSKFKLLCTFICKVNFGTQLASINYKYRMLFLKIILYKVHSLNFRTN